MDRILATLLLGSSLLAQSVPVHVAGRVLDTERKPWVGEIDSTPGGKVFTKPDGTFDLLITPGTQYKVIIGVASMTLLTVDSRNLDLGNLILSQSPVRKMGFAIPSVWLDGPMRWSGPARQRSSLISSVVCSNGGGMFALLENTARITFKKAIEGNCDRVEIHESRKIAGAVALTSECCQSYAIPTGLVLFSMSKGARFIEGESMGAYAWQFLDGGRKVATKHSFPHGDNRFFQLTNAATGKVLETWTNTLPDGGVPAWARGLAQ